MDLKAALNKTRKWNAQWIYLEEVQKPKNAFYYFRKCFNHIPTKKETTLFVSSDTRYQLYINGVFVGRGTPQSQPYYQYYDRHTIDSYLKEGDNCIALITNYVGNIVDTMPGLLLEIVDTDSNTLLGTDVSWKVQKATAWDSETYAYHGNYASPYQEFYDARKEPADWKESFFDDSAWSPSSLVKAMSAWRLNGNSNLGEKISTRPPCVGPWTKLIERDIPFMTNNPVTAQKVVYTEESLDLINRSRKNDLAPGLSLVGKSITYSKLENSLNLCEKNKETIIQSSTNHFDLDFDGMYAPAVVLDFGEVITARAKIQLSAKAGCVIEIGYAERLIDGKFNIAMECEFADRYTTKEGEQEFESFTWKSFRYLKVRFKSCFTPLTIQNIEGVISTYPFEEKGKFKSGDAVLNSVFDISKSTIRLCSNEFIMDTPWREQAQWLGDVSLVTANAISSCFGDTALTKKFFMQAGQNQHSTGLLSNISNLIDAKWLTNIADFSLWWVWGLTEHFYYTGDEELIHRLYPQTLRLLDAHLDYLNDDYLIEDMPYWVFIDWADTDTRGICTAYNALFYGMLEQLQKLATFKNDTYTIDLIQKIRTGMKKHFHATLFDTKRGCYADAWVDNSFSTRISEHANMAAIWAGLCDDECRNDLITTVFESTTSTDFTEAQPYFMAVILSALDKTERFDLALRLIKERWGTRMVEKGATSTYEEWYQNGSWREGEFSGFLRSNSHAWSTCPADFLIRNLIGLTILDPGCSRVALKPKKTDFDYDVIFPTPKGAIEVLCKKGELTITSPKTITVLT